MVEKKEKKAVSKKKTVYLTCAKVGKQFIENGLVIRYGENTKAPNKYSESLKSRIKAGFIKEVS